MKMIRNKLSPLQEENRTGYKQLQNKPSCSPNEADSNKRRSPDKRDAIAMEHKSLHEGRLYKTLTITSKHSFNGGATRLSKTQTQNHCTGGGTMKLK